MPRDITESWTIIDRHSLRDEAALVADLIAEAGLDAAQRARITTAGADLVRRIRASVKPGLMEVFLAEYGLSTDEGIALMCLAEARTLRARSERRSRTCSTSPRPARTPSCSSSPRSRTASSKR